MMLTIIDYQSIVPTLIIVTDKLISSPTAAQVKFFWHFVEKFLKLSSDKEIVTTIFNKMLEKLDFAGNY